MRILLFLGILFAMFVLTIMYAYAPSTVENEYKKIAEPIENHFAKQRAESLKAAKDQAWKEWALKISAPADCAKPVSAIREMECKNFWQQQFNTFDRIWSKRVASGWKPEGVN